NLRVWGAAHDADSGTARGNDPARVCSMPLLVGCPIRRIESFQRSKATLGADVFRPIVQTRIDDSDLYAIAGKILVHHPESHQTMSPVVCSGCEKPLQLDLQACRRFNIDARPEI